jgi:O-antigen ligase
MLALVILDIGANRRSDMLKSPLVPPIILLFLAIVMSFAVSIHSHLNNPGVSWDFRNAYNSARPLFLYLFFFIVAFGIRTNRQLKFIINTAIVLAVIVSILLVVQYFLGTHIKVFFGTPWSDIRIEGLEQDKNIIRSMPPGQALILILFPATLCLSFSGSGREKLFYRITCLLISIGLIFGFSRSAWLSVIIMIPIIWILASRHLKWKIAVFTTITISITVLSCLLLGNIAPGSAGDKFSKAATERFTSIFQNETLHKTGIKHRFNENYDAIRAIRANPIFGIGAGNPIRIQRWTLPNGQQGFSPSYSIHNSYLELWLVYGFLGVIAYAWLSIIFLIRSLLLYLRARNPFYKFVALACFVAYIAALICAAGAMTLLHQIYWITCIAFIWGCVEAMWRLENEQSLQKLPNDVHLQMVCSNHQAR